MDTTVPHSARIWNYWLGGTENFPVDREVGERLREVYPAIVDLARSDRQFLGRAVAWLAGEAGIRQFLDIGSGLPAADNTHQVAQRVAPEARVVYVDNDPLVIAHARELLTSGPQGATGYVEGDFRKPAEILDAASAVLDLSRPVAVMLLGVLGHFGNDEEVAFVIRHLMRAAAPGSYLVVAHGSATSPGLVAAAEQYAASGAEMYHLREPAQLERFFDGLELVPPGIVPVPQWHPGAAGPEGAGGPEAYSYCGVGRKLAG